MINWNEAPEEATHVDTDFNMWCNESGWWWAEGGYTHGPNLDWGTNRYTLIPQDFTQAMLNDGERIQAGMKFYTKAGCYIAELVNERSVCFTNEGGMLIVIDIASAQPMRTDEELAIKDISRNQHITYAGLVDVIKVGGIHGVRWVGSE
tara:strand:- start:77 stop:523 length:447 start_codon:yes stop_codon:yes gene_type:complete